MAILPNVIYKCNVTPNKILMAFLIEVEQQQQKPQNVCNHKTRKSLHKLKKKEQIQTSNYATKLQ